MLEKIKKAIKKMKPAKKKAEPKFNNMNDLQKGVAVNKERNLKLYLKLNHL